MTALWQNGYVEDCKSLYSGSIPDSASSNLEKNRPNQRISAAGDKHSHWNRENPGADYISHKPPFYCGKSDGRTNPHDCGRNNMRSADRNS